MDIVITLPKNIKWSDYRKELEPVKNYDGALNYCIKELPKVKKGDRAYLLWNGYIRGWQEIVGVKKDYSFKCEVTGRQWRGNFVLRSGPFHYFYEPFPMKGFRGFIYAPLNLTNRRSYTE